MPFNCSYLFLKHGILKGEKACYSSIQATMLKVTIFKLLNAFDFLPLVSLLRARNFLVNRKNDKLLGLVSVNVCSGSGLKLNAITDNRMQNQEESLRYSPYLWVVFILICCPNPAPKKAFRKENSAVIIHFNGLSILTNYNFFVLQHKKIRSLWWS